MADGRRVFVLMPFEESLDSVYRTLIKGVFEDAGFRVLRADDISSQQNILKDIVVSIREADFIVADLTGSNENVYYELGLAHALRKRVVLLSQDVSKAPFDLRSYRIIAYGTTSDEFERAKVRLTEYATKMAADEMSFGSPFSDFGAPDDTESGAHALLTEGQTVASQMSEEAQAILKAAVAGDGNVLQVRRGGRPGAVVQAGEKSFIPESADARTVMAWVAGVEELEENGYIRGVSYESGVFEVTHAGYGAADMLYDGVTTQRRVWMELNGGEDRGGARPMDGKGRETIARHEGVQCGAGWRFPDGSILGMRGNLLVASPDM